MAYLETLTGYEGTSLIVFFGTDVLKADPAAVLEGATYSGVPRSRQDRLAFSRPRAPTPFP